MADAWQTYAFEFKGGLVSNLSPLQQGIQQPGSARELKNFEPATSGGYRRILGFEEYDTDFVPSFGAPVVQGSGQTGNTLVIANLDAEPNEGDTFTIAGDVTVYTIDVGGVSYNSSTKQATLTLTDVLTASPADKAVVAFIQQRGLIDGVAAWDGVVVAVRSSNVYKSTGSGYTKVNVPAYGSVTVNGGSQTGTSLIVAGLTAVPQQGDTFSVAGIEQVYTVLSVPTVTGGGATLSISPALATSPTDGAAVTWLSTRFNNTGKVRFDKYRIGTSEKIVGVAKDAFPFIYDNTTYTALSSVPDIAGAEHVVWFKNQIFFAKGDKLTFTAPYTDNDFNPANGAGTISVGNRITGLKVFREQLVIFSEQRINRLVGNTLADFVLQPITVNVGCVAEDTIQELGGDIIFLGPDGLRLLSATDRIGDFGLAVVSKAIQKEMTQLISASTFFSSITIKEKSQYRLLGFNQAINTASSLGIIGTQLELADTTGMNWAQLQGVRAYVADSDYHGMSELIVFAHSDGYVYRMESGNSFDGEDIVAVFSTPYVPFNDPRIRKTFYKLFLYTDPQGSVTTTVNLKLDFDDQGSIQPETISIGNTTGAVGFYGSPLAVYGVTVFGDKLKRVFDTQLIGSGFSGSLQFVSIGKNPPFSLDAATVEYASHDRR
jgi:hypothetical protein